MKGEDLFLRKQILRNSYNALIDSTGFFLAAKYTGRKVEMNATTSATPIMSATDSPPNTNSATSSPISDFRMLLSTPVRTIVPTRERIVQMPR